MNKTSKIIGVTLLAFGGYKTMLTLKLNYFLLREFRGEHIFLSFGVMQALDNFRKIVGVPVGISPASGAMIRFVYSGDEGAAKNSEHFYGRAIDFIINPFYMQELRKKHGSTLGIFLRNALQTAGFTGIGIYLDSAGIKDRTRFHGDVRPQEVEGKISQWGQFADGKTSSFAEVAKLV